LQNQLKLIGLVRSELGVLTLRNKIYQQVFGKKWISENMPPPPERSRRLVMVLVAIIVLLLAVIFVPLMFDWRVAWNPTVIQANTLRDNILSTTSADAQIIKAHSESP
jgi:hypothetical protein